MAGGMRCSNVAVQLWIALQVADIDIAQSQRVGFDEIWKRCRNMSWSVKYEEKGRKLYHSVIGSPIIELTYPEYNGSMRSYCMIQSAHWCIMALQLCLQTKMKMKLGMQSGTGMPYPLDTHCQFSQCCCNRFWYETWLWHQILPDLGNHILINISMHVVKPVPHVFRWQFHGHIKVIKILNLKCKPMMMAMTLLRKIRWFCFDYDDDDDDDDYGDGGGDNDDDDDGEDDDGGSGDWWWWLVVVVVLVVVLVVAVGWGGMWNHRGRSLNAHLLIVGVYHTGRLALTLLPVTLWKCSLLGGKVEFLLCYSTYQFRI